MRRLSRNDLVRIVIFSLWFVVAGVGVLRHAVWRDEVRALAVALQGDTLLDMLRQLRAEGHPGLWYLALRFGHDLTGSVMAVQVLAFAT